MNTPHARPSLLVGLTGGIGSGKTTVADLFSALGVPLIDADLIAHALTGPDGAAMPAIRDAFGPSVIAADGRLDRPAMRALAFQDPDSRQRLESILHPMIGAETARRIAAAADQPYAMLVVPLLIESGRWQSRVDRVVVVDCPVDTQIARVMQRSQLERTQIEAIIAAQASRTQRLAAANDVIDNTGDDPLALHAPVRALHAQYLSIAMQRARTIGNSK